MEIVLNRADYEAAARALLLSSEGRKKEAQALWELTGVPLPPFVVVAIFHDLTCRHRRAGRVTIIEEVQIADDGTITCNRTEVVCIDPRQFVNLLADADE